MHRLSLVVAAHNEDAGVLSTLDIQAERLRAVLADPGLGCCVPAATAEATTKTGIEQAVSRAIRDAGRQRATLVLAFLGHGFTTDHGTDLYYLASDTVPTSTTTGVDVGRLLTEAVDEPGIAGVIALVDTCHAAGGLPDLRRITGGIGRGRNRLAVLYGATADQPAFDLRFTASLTTVLHDGLPNAGRYLHIGTELVGAVRAGVTGQNVGQLVHDADPYAVGSLWLARNAAHRTGSSTEVAGPTGRATLRQAVADWLPDHPMPHRWDEAAIAEVADLLSVPADNPDPERYRAATEVHALRDCVRAARTLLAVLGQRLTTANLLAAARLAGITPDRELSGTVLLRDLLERAVLRHARVRRHRLETVFRFVAALAVQCDLDRTDPTLRAWADDLDAGPDLNDAFDLVTTARQVEETRLIVSLANSLTGWPDEIEAWLRRGRRELPLYHRERCARADRPGVEAAIGAVIRWARGQLAGDEALEHVDIVASAHLLARWYPEEADVGAHLLGVHHVVTPRWSGRLQPPASYSDINHAARRTLARMAEVPGAPVDWLEPEDLADPAALHHKLKTGAFTRAIGLDHVPADLPDVLDQLLPYSPVLLWPRPDSAAGCSWAEAADRHWHTWPSGLLLAYRRRVQADTDTDTTVQSCLRTAWHDEPWLEFCHWFETRSVVSLEEKP